MSLTVVSAPSVEPVTLDELKLHLRLDPDQNSEDELLDELITTAREHAETYCSRSFVTTSLRLDMDHWWGGRWLRLPRAPLLAVSAVQYLDGDGTLQTWAASNYVVHAPAGSRSGMGRIARAPNVVFPTLQSDAIQRVRISYTSGYGATAASVPSGIRSAIKLLAAEAYEQRREVVIGVNQSPAALAARRLLGPYRILAA